MENKVSVMRMPDTMLTSPLAKKKYEPKPMQYGEAAPAADESLIGKDTEMTGRGAKEFMQKYGTGNSYVDFWKFVQDKGLENKKVKVRFGKGAVIEKFVDPDTGIDLLGGEAPATEQTGEVPGGMAKGGLVKVSCAAGGPVDKKWIQSAVPPSHEGMFAQWCKDHGFSGVSQEAINAAVKEGGHAAQMANFAINVSKGKYQHPGKEVGGPVEAAAPDQAAGPEAAAPEKTTGAPFDSYAKTSGMDPELIKRGNSLFTNLERAISEKDDLEAERYGDEIKQFVKDLETARTDAVSKANDTTLAATLKEMINDARDLLSAYQNMAAEAPSPEAEAAKETGEAEQPIA